MFRQTETKSAALAILLTGLVAYMLLGGYFAREIVIEIAVLAIMAVALDMVAGYGGMISLCHGALLGLGAYTFAAATVHFGVPPAVAMLLAMVTTAALGAAVGAVTARTRGIFFIMATLAFGQMAYALVFDSKWLGGDDGMSGIARLDLSAVGIDLSASLPFALFALAALAFAYAIAALVLRSGFGRSLVGIRENEDRIRALGVGVTGIKARAFAISAALCGMAGAMAAQHTMFVSPELLVWTVSGEALVVVILGGLGTLVGPILGAAVLVLLKHTVSDWTSYWHMAIGAALILTVMAGGRGLYGGLEHWIGRRGAHNRPPAAEPEDRMEAEADA